MKLNPDQRRQGDVLFVRVDKLPAWAKTRIEPKDGERIVIEHGEASNHAHAFREPVTCFRATTAEMAASAGLDAVLIGGSGATLRHEYPDGAHAEHAPIAFAPRPEKLRLGYHARKAHRLHLSAKERANLPARRLPAQSRSRPMSKALEAAKAAVQTEIGAYVLTDAMANRIARAAITAYLRAVAEEPKFRALISALEPGE